MSMIEGAQPRSTFQATLDAMPEPADRRPQILAEFVRDAGGIADELVSVLVSKQRDYGPNNIALAPGGPMNGLLVRMFDKINRLENLLASGAEPENESLEDTFVDLANYGIIGLMVQRGLWPSASR